MKPIFSLLFIIWAADVELKSRQVSEVVCTFKDKTFSPGDRWHPYLEPFGLMLCMQCGCTETGHVKCNTIRCPTPQCEHPVSDPQHCCPRCTDEPRIPAGLRAVVKSCRHNGTVYQPGDTFTKHDLFPSRQTNQCVMCTCSNGNIFCALKTCQPLTCSTPVPVPDTCCLVCKDDGISGSSSTEDGTLQLNRGVRHSVDHCAGEPMKGRSSAVRGTPRALGLSKLNLRGAAETTVKILLQRKHQRACLYSGKTYSHGDVWHPVLGRVLECILCTCTDGLQDCKRITCPSQYPCQHPIKPAGKCCKTCQELKSQNNQTQCYLGHSNLLVYKVESSKKIQSHNTVKILAVERLSTAEVELEVWKTIEGVLQLMEIGDIEKKEVTDHPENYTLLTTVHEETWRKFKEEMEKRSNVPQTTCEDGIRDIVRFLNPRQTEDTCPP